MSALAVAASSASTSLQRYKRSWGLWLILLVAPVGARFMISDDAGHGVAIAIGDHLPVMTAPVLGVWLGIVVSTLLLPVGYAYLRANTTRRQPWQIEEVTGGSRIAMSLGRFAADALVLLAVLAALTLAGVLLCWLLVPKGFPPQQMALGLWIVAGPALVGLAAIRTLFDAVPLLRGRFGDAAYAILWLGSIAVTASIDGLPSRFDTNLVDYAGFYRPLVGGSPDGSTNFAIGGVEVKPGRIPLDVMKGLGAPGYAASRAAWVGIAVALAAFAGLVYRPHRPRRQRGQQGRIAKLLAAGPPRAADPLAPPAGSVALPFVGLVQAEARLIGAGQVFVLLALGAAVSGLFGDYRHVGSAVASLLLVFALSAHAGRSEARGLQGLVGVATLPPMARRIAFVLAGIGWSVLLAIPAAAIRMSGEPLLLGLATGASASIAAMLLAALSGSAFTPRLVLLIAWYAYLSA